MHKLENKNFDTPDQTMSPSKARMDVVTVGGKTVIRMTFQPGWRWSVDINPNAGADMCTLHHFGYQISGVLHVLGNDGTEIESRAGDVVDIPPGHDAWVVGEEPVVLIDFGGMQK